MLKINTPSRSLGAVLQMRDMLLQLPVRTVTFVNTQAFSAGTRIANADDARRVAQYIEINEMAAVKQAIEPLRALPPGKSQSLRKR